jgi:hypothetical protein
LFFDDAAVEKFIDAEFPQYRSIRGRVKVLFPQDVCDPGSEILINGRWEPIGRPRGHSDRLTPFLAAAVSTRSSVLEPNVSGRRVWPQWEDRGRL